MHRRRNYKLRKRIRRTLNAAAYTPKRQTREVAEAIAQKRQRKGK